MESKAQETEPDPDRYLAPAQGGEVEDRVQRSRFIALLKPVETISAAETELAAIRKLHHKATHHCPAWLLGHPADQPERFCSDDGEPGSSAGLPIARAIDGSGLSDLLLVVVRYYGGVKLGTGGLVRAYGGIAARVLASVTTRTVTRRLPLELRFPYPLMTQVLRLLPGFDAREEGRSCSVDVQLRLAVPASRREALAGMARELFQGRGEVLLP